MTEVDRWKKRRDIRPIVLILFEPTLGRAMVEVPVAILEARGNRVEARPVPEPKVSVEALRKTIKEEDWLKDILGVSSALPSLRL